MSKETKDEKALLEEYARALAAVGEAPASMRSDRLRDLGLTTIGFLDLSRDAGAAMDRALETKNNKAFEAFAETFEAERARLRAKEAGPGTDGDEADAGPPPDLGALPDAPPAMGVKPFAPVPFAPIVAAPNAEARARPAPPPLVNGEGPAAAAAIAPAAPASPALARTLVAPSAIRPVPATSPAPPMPPPLGRGTLRMVVNPGGSTQARVLSAAVAPAAARGGDTVFNPTRLPMLPFAAPATPPAAPMPPMSAPRSAAQPASAARGASTKAPRLTLMEYAALRADILVSSEASRAEVYALFGFTEADDTAEAAAWNARFTADRELFARYMQIFNYLRALRGGKP